VQTRTRRAGPDVGATDAGWKDGWWAAGGVVMRLSWRLVNASCEVWRGEGEEWVRVHGRPVLEPASLAFQKSNRVPVLPTAPWWC
jgi:hypothetical protein